MPSQPSTRYEYLNANPREFLAATALSSDEFHQLLPFYRAAYNCCYPRELTTRGSERQRRPGGGRRGVLCRDVDRLLFILVYVNANPLQALLGSRFGISQSQANYWIHHLLPVLEIALQQWRASQDGKELPLPDVVDAGRDLPQSGRREAEERTLGAMDMRQQLSSVRGLVTARGPITDSRERFAAIERRVLPVPMRSRVATSA